MREFNDLELAQTSGGFHPHDGPASEMDADPWLWSRIVDAAPTLMFSKAILTCQLSFRAPGNNWQDLDTRSLRGPDSFG